MWGLSCFARGIWPIDHDPTVLVHGIVFILLLVLSPMFFGSLVLVLYGFASWFSKGSPIKGRGDHLATHW